MPILQGNDKSICYETFGDPAHPCLILIMGISGQLIHWPHGITQALADKGFYVVTFDNRDVGLSSYYEHLDTPDLLSTIQAIQQGKIFYPPYTLEDMAADVISLMDGLKIDQAHIIGISMGGIIGQIMALDYPDRVKSLTCIATTNGDPYLPPPKPEVMELFFIAPVPVTDMESYVNHMMQLHRIYNHPENINEEYSRTLFARAYERAYYPEGFKRQLLAIINSSPRVERLKKVNQPTLIIHGDADPVFPLQHGLALAESIPGSHLEVIEKMGHGLPESLHNKLVSIIGNFLQQQS